MNRSQLFLIAFLALSCGNFVCFSAEPVAQAGRASSDVQAVDNDKMMAALAKIEQALQGVQTRAAKDGKLKPLASARIQRGRYPGTNGGWIRVDAQTDDRIDLPTEGDPMMTFPGRIEVEAEYTAQRPDLEISGGLFHGFVRWKTDNPNVSVMLGWVTRDLKAPERLLKIVREELQNQGIRMVPEQKSAWPTATLPEHLSQLPFSSTTSSTIGDPTPLLGRPLDQGQPPTLPHPVERGGDGAGKVFATPQEVVAAYHRAYARKDWRTCFLCLTPEARGATLLEFCFVAGMGNTPELVRVIEKHGVKLKFFDADRPGTIPDSKEVDEVFKPAFKQVDGHQEFDTALLYQLFRKRINDVAAFVDECCQQWTLFADFGEVKEIKVEGDRAAGYWTQTYAPPNPNETGGCPPETYLPQYYPFHFRKIGGSWFLADAPLHQ